MKLYFIPSYYGGTLLVAQLDEALRYKPEGRGFDFIDIILPAALWHWGRLSL
jgi:hypothetical protein